MSQKGKSPSAVLKFLKMGATLATKKTYILAAILATVGLTVAIAQLILRPTPKGAKAMLNTEKKIHAVLTGELTFPLNPEDISTIPLFQIHTNLWAPLLSKDVGRGLGNVLKVSDDEKEVIIRINPKAQFSNGRRVTAQDAAFSLQRLLDRSHAGHFNAKALIEKIEAISQEDLKIRLKHPSKAFFYMLTVPETGIVPKEAMDESGGIKSLEVTSGPYFAVGEPSAGKIELKANPYFLGYSEQAPQSVEVSLLRGADNLLKAVNIDKADFLEIYEMVGHSIIDKLRENRDLAMVSTRPSLAMMLMYSDHLTVDTRKALSALLQRNLDYQPRVGIERKSFEFLPPGTFGSLGLTSVPPFKENEKALPKKLTMKLNASPSRLSDAVVKALETADISVTVIDRKDTRPFDMRLGGQGMNSEYPEIEMHLTMVSKYATVGSSAQTKALIDEALHTNDDSKRMGLIQQVSKAVLDEARVFPLVVTSYVHVIRKETLRVPDYADYDGDVQFDLMKLK